MASVMFIEVLTNYLAMSRCRQTSPSPPTWLPEPLRASQYVLDERRPNIKAELTAGTLGDVSYRLAQGELTLVLLVCWF